VIMISMTYAYIGLTDLLYSEVGVLGLQLLVHSISEDDPAVHRTRRFLDAGICATWRSDCLDCLCVGLCDCLKVKVVLVLWHLDNSLAAVAVVGKGESDRLPHLLNESALKVLHEHVAEELLDISLEQDHGVTTVPALKACIERILKERHAVFVCDGNAEGVLNGSGQNTGFGGHCRVGSVCLLCAGDVKSL
jgi:hypothetical protein